MDKDWIPLIDERDGVQVICLLCHTTSCRPVTLHFAELRSAVDRAGPQTGAAGKSTVEIP